MVDVEKTALALVLSLPSLAALLITWEHLVQPLPKIAFLCSFQYSYFYPVKLYDPEPEMTKCLSWCHLHIVTILALLIFFLMYSLKPVSTGMVPNMNFRTTTQTNAGLR